MKERGEALRVLKQFETSEGKLRVPELMKEVFVQTYVVQKQLEAGAQRFNEMEEKMDRCPVLDGTATWEGIHLPPSPPLAEPELPPDQVRLSGRIRTRTLITIVLVIVLASSGGAALAWVTKLGGLP